MHKVELLPMSHLTLCFIDLRTKEEEEEVEEEEEWEDGTCNDIFVAVLMTSSRAEVVRGILFTFSDSFLKDSAHDRGG